MLLNISVLLICIILAFLYIKIAEKFNIVDKPNHRSSHSIPTIRGGGVLFYFAILIYFIYSKFQYPFFFIGTTIIALVSYIDDLISLSSKLRLVFQVIAIFLVLYQITIIGDLSGLLLFLFFIIGIGFINIYNFMDGINGITGFYSLSVLLGFFALNFQNQIIDNQLLVFLVIAIIVFGYFNFRKKARFFAGDIGSISIAMILFFLVVLFYMKLQAPVLVLLFLVYGTDAVLTLIYRKIIGENITEAHRHHVYQKLTDVKQWSHLKISLYYGLIQVLINVLVYYSYQLEIYLQWIIVAIVILISLLSYMLIFKLFNKISND